MKRLIIFFIIFAVFLTFIVLNLDENHRCDVSIPFRTFENVPVFVSALFSFALGMLFAAILVLFLGKGRKKAPAFLDDGSSPKKRWGKKDSSSVHDDPGSRFGGSLEEEHNKGNSPYGID